jgi:hypothetical protein
MTTTNFIHRDDVDYPVVERLEKALAGTKVVFAGDLSETEQSRIREVDQCSSAKPLAK